MLRWKSMCTGLLVAPAMLLWGCGDAEAGADEGAVAAAGVLPGAASDGSELASAGNENWINLNGEIVSASPSSFILDYGNGNVNVEMDDWDWYQEGRFLTPGDEVTVTGRVDDDLFHNRRIEASGVYVENLGTYFYANGADEEELLSSRAYVPSAPNYVDASGTVAAVEGREFTLSGAWGPLRVDTSAMSDNPLDAEGFQKIKQGDRVYVWGDLDLDRAENPELQAKGVVSLTPDKNKATG